MKRLLFMRELLMLYDNGRAKALFKAARCVLFNKRAHISPRYWA